MPIHSLNPFTGLLSNPRLFSSSIVTHPVNDLSHFDRQSIFVLCTQCGTILQILPLYRSLTSTCSIHRHTADLPLTTSSSSSCRRSPLLVDTCRIISIKCWIERPACLMKQFSFVSGPVVRPTDETHTRCFTNGYLRIQHDGRRCNGIGMISSRSLNKSSLFRYFTLCVV